MHPPIQFVQTIDGVTIAHCRHGQGPPLVFVRGWVSHLEFMWDVPDFRAFIEAFARRFEVVRFDSRGNGLSDHNIPPPTLDSLTLDLEAVTDALGLQQFVLYGTAFGALIALAYAAKHPERVSKLIVDGTYARGSDLAPKEQREAFMNMIRTLPEPAAYVLSLLTNPDREGSQREVAERGRRSTSDKTLTDLYGLAYEIDLQDVLPRIQVPTLVMHRRGARSIAFELGRRVASQIDGARFVALEGRSLNPWEGDAGEVINAISSFLGVPLAIEQPQPVRQPSPPLTILFTDLEGSTALTSRIGDAQAQELLRAHDALIRDRLRALSGREIKHTGDGIMAAFASASAAVECAISIQRAFAERNAKGQEEPLRVKIALNAGEPVSENQDLFGTSVQVAARILDRAEPGQVLVANVVRELVAGKRFSFRPLGESLLRGLEEPIGLYEVAWSG